MQGCVAAAALSHSAAAAAVVVPAVVFIVGAEWMSHVPLLLGVACEEPGCRCRC